MIHIHDPLAYIMKGDDHRLLWRLLLRLYSVDSSSVFHAIILQENLDNLDSAQINRSRDTLSALLKEYLPQLKLSCLDKKLTPIYTAESGLDTFCDGSLIQHLGFHPVQILRQARHDLLVSKHMPGLPPEMS